MLQVKSLADVNKLLLTVFPPPYALKEAYNLDRMTILMRALDNPQNQLKVIHVAGTSGKTSTSYYAAAYLRAAGQKVGLTVSPHIEAINERVQINLQPLAETVFCRYFEEFINLKGVIESRPTYFEFMIAFAYWVFARKEKVDYAVVEVGLGGLGDSTNIIDRADKVCVLTDIGMDHMHILGDTIQKIAAQKAGIIKDHNQAFTINQDESVLAVFRRAVRRRQATLSVVEDLPNGTDLAPFAWRDWQLAAATGQYVVQRDGLPSLTATQLSAASHTIVPARMEIFKIGDKTVILDGSHNQQKLAALAAGLKQRFGGQDIALLIGFVNSRADRVDDAVKEILPLAKQVV
ncbi:MAG: Mur ligase family protein, partial [Candidatus Saccharimonadales bacterium]